MKGTMRLVLLVSLAAMATSSTTYAFPLTNGGFESDAEPDGIPDGWTVEGVAILAAFGGQNILRLAEQDDQAVNAGGLSRVYQDFDPTGATHLAFEFQFVTNPVAGKAHVPPDGFSASLLDASNPATNPKPRVGLPGGSVPDFAAAFLYVNSDGKFVYDPPHVTLIGPNGEADVSLTTAGCFRTRLSTTRHGRRRECAARFGAGSRV